MKTLRILAALILLIGLAIGVALTMTSPIPLVAGTVSASRLRPGPYAIDVSERVWVDESRPTDPNGDYEGAPSRSFDVALWAPVDAPGPHPLVIYSHGFMSTRHGGTHLGQHLASHGYVVVSANYPLTHFGAPGGPNANDFVHQPGDVSFLIDQALALRPDERSFRGGIDRERIAVMGVSLGGLTSTLVAYHPRYADPRIRAAISIAGPGVLFDENYFEFADIPFLMIGGTHDAMIQFDENAAGIPDKIATGGLVAIKGGSHAGFSYLTSGPLRIIGNPDEIGCATLMENLDIEEGTNPFPGLGGPYEGIIDSAGSALPCEIRFADAMRAGRQQWFTMLAAHAFLESHFATDPTTRESHAQFLAETLPRENKEVEYVAARR